MTKEQARSQFAELVSRDETTLELDRAALLIAAGEYPRLDVEEYLSELDAFADMARARDDAFADPLARIRRLSNLLFDELQFRGNAEKYYDARNSFLNDVIDRRLGLPITLSVVMIEIGRRIGLKLFGVGMPGHFMAKYADDEQEIFVDPFHGGRIVNEERCQDMVSEMYKGQMKFHPSFLYAVGKKQILARMLQNLKGIYSRAKNYHQTLAMIELALLVNPEALAEIRDRGMVCFALGKYGQARMDFEEYLRRSPQADDASEIKKRLIQLRQKQAQLN
ncbi:MAG: transglutaminase-like domain-containing protein [Acidobacteriota bacterium]|nr:transglutaminase-like domain-containing protein [Acidobacteriota bacterium]